MKLIDLKMVVSVALGVILAAIVIMAVGSLMHGGKMGKMEGRWIDKDMMDRSQGEGAAVDMSVQ